MACALPPLGTNIYTTKGGKTKGKANQDSNSNSNGEFKPKSLED
jgi:hypothetical protein